MQFCTEYSQVIFYLQIFQMEHPVSFVLLKNYKRWIYWDIRQIEGEFNSTFNRTHIQSKSPDCEHWLCKTYLESFLEVLASNVVKNTFAITFSYLNFDEKTGRFGNTTQRSRSQSGDILYRTFHLKKLSLGSLKNICKASKW